MTEKEKQEVYQKQLRERHARAVRRQRRRLRRKVEAVSKLVLLLLSLTLICLIVTRHYGENAEKLTTDVSSEQTASSNIVSEVSLPAIEPEAEQTQTAQLPDTSFRIGSAGDVILHTPITKAYGGMSSSAAHDFSPIFETIKNTYAAVDYMVVNLETSLGGTDKPYSGFPNFNAPDEIVTNLRDAGVDMQLLANNHIYDNAKDGFLRTISVLNQNGIEYTGARTSEQDLPYLLKDINGIRVGIINYTYEMEHEGERKSINGNIMDKSVESLLNSFEVSEAELFYSELARLQTQMREQGAEFIILYIHWGNEYELEPNETQKEMAARFCEMGIDAVIGGHPHVVQPMDVLLSSDGTHKMFCAYSLGNHLSNQRREQISSRPNGHTEDGLILNLTISRVNGQVSITGLEAIPTYVYKSSQPKYYVIPIYQVEGIEEQTGLKGIRASVQASYERTMKILGNGVEDAKRELGIVME